MKTWAFVALSLILSAGYVVLILRSARARRVARWAAWIPGGILGLLAVVVNWKQSPANALFLGVMLTLLVWGGMYWQFRRNFPSKFDGR